MNKTAHKIRLFVVQLTLVFASLFPIQIFAAPHPADISPQDYKITIDEVTAYGACWKSAPYIAPGCPSNPVANLNDAVRAGTVWGATPTGTYHFDSLVACPLCYAPGPNVTYGPGQFLWVDTPTSGGTDRGYAVTTDSNGNVIAVGRLNNMIFVNKYTALGTLLWSRQYDGGIGSANGVVTDASGNIFVAGSYSTYVNFGGGNLPPGSGFTDIFVLKLNAAGDHSYSRGIVGNQWDQARGIAIDSSGDIYVTGAYGAYGVAVDFSTISPRITLTPSGGPGDDIFVAKFSGQDLHTIWAKGFGIVDDSTSNGTTPPDGETGIGIAVNSFSEVFVTGMAMSGINFGKGQLTVKSATFLLQMSGADGSTNWAEAFGDQGPDGGYSAAITPEGEVVISGMFKDTMTLPTATSNITLTTNAGDTDIFIAKFSRTGNAVWGHSFTGSIFNQFLPDEGNGVAVGRDGSVALTGQVSGNVNFLGTTGTAGSGYGYVVKFNSDGGSVPNGWPKTFAGSTGLGTAIGPDGKVYATGYWGGTVNFGDGTSRTSQGSDPLIIGYAP